MVYRCKTKQQWEETLQLFILRYLWWDLSGPSLGACSQADLVSDKWTQWKYEGVLGWVYDTYILSLSLLEFCLCSTRRLEWQYGSHMAYSSAEPTICNTQTQNCLAHYWLADMSVSLAGINPARPDRGHPETYRQVLAHWNPFQVHSCCGNFFSQ